MTTAAPGTEVWAVESVRDLLADTPAWRTAVGADGRPDPRDYANARIVLYGRAPEDRPARPFAVVTWPDASEFAAETVCAFKGTLGAKVMIEADGDEHEDVGADAGRFLTLCDAIRDGMLETYKARGRRGGYLLTAFRRTAGPTDSRQAEAKPEAEGGKHEYLWRVEFELSLFVVR
jgi:hypothetical protein